MPVTLTVPTTKIKRRGTHPPLVSNLVAGPHPGRRHPRGRSTHA